MPPKGVLFRPIEETDIAFLYRVYASTRQEELAPLNWSVEELDSFLSMQFQMQHQQYMSNFPDATFWVVVRDGCDIGRLYVDRRETAIHIIDIALLPDYRNLGIGSALLKEIIDEAHAKNKVVSIYVEKNNPALRLYHRLGFCGTEDKGVYMLMVCQKTAKTSVGE